jgi:hypothetical protein
MLLDRGASQKLDAQGHTARSRAEKLGDKEIIAILDEQLT